MLAGHQINAVKQLPALDLVLARVAPYSFAQRSARSGLLLAPRSAIFIQDVRLMATSWQLITGNTLVLEEQNMCGTGVTSAHGCFICREPLCQVGCLLLCRIFCKHVEAHRLLLIDLGSVSPSEMMAPATASKGHR